MAFQATIKTDRQREIQNAYISAIIVYGDKNKVEISLRVWRSAEDREAFPTIPEFLLPNVELPVDLDVPCNNHIQYAYELLENSGLFPDAVWNV